MYRRDLVTAEIENLGKVVAAIMKLKLEGKLPEAETLLNETLAKNFNLPNELLTNPDVDLFQQWLSDGNLLPEKLDSLREFLYFELGTSHERNKLMAPKLNLIYNHLSDKHKIVHLTNLHRQEIVQQYL